MSSRHLADEIREVDRWDLNAFGMSVYHPFVKLGPFIKVNLYNMWTTEQDDQGYQHNTTWDKALWGYAIGAFGFGLTFRRGSKLPRGLVRFGKPATIRNKEDGRTA